MQRLNGTNIDELKYKDIVIFVFVCEYPLKTVKELKMITGTNYSRLTESLKTLVDKNILIKTETFPAKFIKNDN